MSRLKLFIPVFVFLALAAMLWRGLYLDPRTLPSVLIDKPLPEFELRTLETGDQLVSKEDLPDEPVLLNVWGSYCLPCLQENPIFMAAREDGVIPIIGINYKDQPENARRFLGRYGNPFAAVGADANGRASIEWGVYGVPETYVIDAQGRIRYKVVGPVMQGPVDTYRAILDQEGLAYDVADEPQVYLSPTESWTDVVVRYLVDARERRKWSSALHLRIGEAIAEPEHRERIRPAYPVRIHITPPEGSRP